MFFSEHNPPHFHVSYAGREATILIDTLEIQFGDLPKRARALAVEWASLHRAELQTNWDLARSGMPLNEIEPLE
jgi:hypothetical protein